MSAIRTVTLGDERYFSFVSGLWSGKRAPLVNARVIRSTNFRSDGTLDYGDVAQLSVEANQLKARRLQRSDIIIERSGGGPKQPVGRVGLFNPPDNSDYATSNFTTAVRVNDATVLNPEYVCLVLHALYVSGATVALQRATTGIRNLDWSEYQSTAIPYIHIDEQRDTAALLTSVRTASRIAETQQQRLTLLKKSVAHRLFGYGLRQGDQKESSIGFIPKQWDLVEFEQLRHWLQYGTSTRCTLERSAHPVLRIPNVLPGRVDPANLKFAKLSEEEAARYRLEEGDLLFIRTNGVIERLGACAVYTGQPEGALFASYLIRARLDRERIDPFFAAHFLGSEIGTAIVAGRATPAADGKYNLNTGTIDSLPIPLPPTLDEQREIVMLLDAIDRKIDLHRRKRAVLDDLFKALLHKLMTGELRVADLDLSALTESAA